jgi:hypothetical protein
MKNKKSKLSDSQIAIKAMVDYTKTKTMQVTEQNKQEAEKVVEKYQTLSFYAISCAIINRQSVLEEFKKIPYPSNYVGYKIQSLTEQIEYLKSKL